MITSKKLSSAALLSFRNQQMGSTLVLFDFMRLYWAVATVFVWHKEYVGNRAYKSSNEKEKEEHKE